MASEPETSGAKRSKAERAKRIAPTALGILIGAGLELSPLESRPAAFACFFLAGAWLLWLYAEPGVVSALARKVAAENQADQAGELEQQVELARLRADEQRERSERQLALAQIAEELEICQDALSGHDAQTFFVNYDLPVHRWNEHGQRLIDAGALDLHRKVRKAYRAINAVNDRGVRRGLVTGRTNRPTTQIDTARASEALSAIRDALAALGEVSAGEGRR